ncbi:hypothetical protein ABC955_10010 [Citromicrobium bathyomarinum]
MTPTPPEEPKAIRDYFKYNYAANQIYLADARDSYRATIARRDALLDRMRVGSLSLNGVTLLAGLTEFADEFALEPWSGGGGLAVSLFIAGIVLAILSMRREHLHLINIAGKQGIRLNAFQRIAARLEGELSDDAIEHLGEELTVPGDHPPMDHSLDQWANRFLHLSATCWLLGLIVGLTST